VRVSQRLKSLRRILVRNCGFSESDFFVVCEDIWIAICPFFVVVNLNMIYLSSDLDIAKRTHVALEEITNVTSLLDFKHDIKKITKCT
jgi:hypothetical protein